MGRNKLTSLILALPLFAPLLMALLLALQAQTASGRLTGFAFTILFLAIPFALFTWRPEWTRARKTLQLAAPLSLFLLLLAWAYLLTPKGAPPPGSSVRQVYLDGGGYRRASLANLAPEIDQLNLGITLFPLLDPSLGGTQQTRLRRLFLDVYREMEASPDFRALGSNMNYAYRELFFRKFDVGHAYVYIPRPPGLNKKLPVVLFLHGSLGNFKGYTWALKELADRCSCAIVAPSFGLGNWSRSGGKEAVERARRWIAAQPELDSDKIHLAALSNGGRGLTRAAIAAPRAYRSLISISGYLEEDLVRSNEFATGWAGRPVLILQGSRDDRVLPEQVQNAVSLMILGGAHVRQRIWPDEDHFLFFSARREVIRELESWLAQNP